LGKLDIGGEVFIVIPYRPKPIAWAGMVCARWAWAVNIYGAVFGTRPEWGLVVIFRGIARRFFVIHHSSNPHHTSAVRSSDPIAKR
jgi:hypothetical protein